MVVVGADVHKRTHTFVAVDEVGRKLGEKVGGGHHGRSSTRRWCGPASSSAPSWCGRIEDCRHLSARLERDLLTAGQQVVRVPPKLMAQTRASRRGPGASPIRSMRWRSRGRCCANPTCRSRPTTRCHGSSSCSSIVVKTLSGNAPRRSTGCCGESTSSTPSRRPEAGVAGPGQAPRAAAALAGHRAWPGRRAGPRRARRHHPAHRGHQCVGQTHRRTGPRRSPRPCWPCPAAAS